MEFYNSRPIYLQIADHIVRQVLSKELNAGDRLLSVREIAADIEVNANTIVKSYSWLADQGIIKMQRGIGYFVLDDAHDIAAQLLQKELLDNDLPRLIEKAALLNISIDELIKNYIHEEKK
jgi:DNA-binding transcriptional regulator YhcF (GntR family)